MKKLKKGILLMSCMMFFLCGCGDSQEETGELSQNNTLGQQTSESVVSKNTNKEQPSQTQNNRMEEDEWAQGNDSITEEVSKIVKADIEDFEYRYNIGYDENGKVLTDGSAGYIITGLKNTTLTEFIIPDGVVEIDEGCFQGNDYITKVIVPDSVKVIDVDAFALCDNLTYVEMPSELNELGNAVFRYCEKLESIRIPDGITSLERTFLGCSNLRYVEWTEGLEVIGSETFADCISLQSIEIPKTVTHIGYSAFEGCTSLNTVHLPPELERLGTSVFLNCVQLNNIELPRTLKYIGGAAFFGCASLKNIEIPSGVDYLYDGTFAGCTGLLTIRIPADVIGIERNTFHNILTGEAKNFIIITEPNAYAIEYAETYGYDYGIEDSGWVKVPEWNVGIGVSYETDNYTGWVYDVREDEKWYIHFSFDCNIDAQTEAFYSIESSNGYYVCENFGGTVKKGDKYVLEVESFSFAADECVVISVMIDDETYSLEVNVLEALPTAIVSIDQFTPEEWAMIGELGCDWIYSDCEEVYEEGQIKNVTYIGSAVNPEYVFFIYEITMEVKGESFSVYQYIRTYDFAVKRDGTCVYSDRTVADTRIICFTVQDEWIYGYRTFEEMVENIKYYEVDFYFIEKYDVLPKSIRNIADLTEEEWDKIGQMGIEWGYADFVARSQDEVPKQMAYVGCGIISDKIFLLYQIWMEREGNLVLSYDYIEIDEFGIMKDGTYTYAERTNLDSWGVSSFESFIEQMGNTEMEFLETKNYKIIGNSEFVPKKITSVETLTKAEWKALGEKGVEWGKMDFSDMDDIWMLKGIEYVKGGVNSDGVLLIYKLTVEEGNKDISFYNYIKLNGAIVKKDGTFEYDSRTCLYYSPFDYYTENWFYFGCETLKELISNVEALEGKFEFTE